MTKIRFIYNNTESRYNAELKVKYRTKNSEH